MDFLRRQEDATPSVPKQALGIEEFSFHVSIGVSDWILDGRWAMGDGRGRTELKCSALAPSKQVDPLIFK